MDPIPIVLLKLI